MCTFPRFSSLLFTVLLAALLTACAAVKVEPRSPLYERVGKSELSVGVLRIRVRDMARRFPGVLEATADELAALSRSPSDREKMVRFKSNAVPAMQGALLQPDPVAALIDAWALLAQMQQVLPKWAEGAPPEVMDTAQRSLGMLESEVETLWRELSGREDVSQLRQLVHGWAAEHPLTGPIITRESTVPLLAAFTDRSGVGLLGSTAALLADTQDLVTRVDLYAGSLPRQARWQAELAVQEMVEGTPVLTSAMDEMGRAVDVLVRMGALAGTTPAVVTREREALQDFISSERLAVLEGMRGERLAVMDSLHTERVETLAQTDTMGRGWVDHAFDRAEALVDHIFLWLLGLTALLVAGALGVAALLARGGRPGARPRWGRWRRAGGPPRDEGPAVPGPEVEHGPPGEHPGEPHH
ncbi:chemotaxis protein [Archangium lansingense]|uniref:Chemotaxis protein n=1 Tax=Archangium lansingense TaxID=2995310 RepID=A0ABT4AMT4_9BACT|nr:chemotaxis protein [Archangium lansinium]MCY1082164.1 chemotaxis protein [Archangium lansinium]